MFDIMLREIESMLLKVSLQSMYWTGDLSTQLTIVSDVLHGDN